MSNSFVIIEPDPIVCMDLEGLMIAEYPDCHVTTGRTLADVGPAINNCGTDMSVFVRGSLMTESVDLKRVLQAAATRGSRIVIIGEAEELDFPAAFIELPFTNDIVIAAVANGPTMKGAKTVE